MKNNVMETKRKKSTPRSSPACPCCGMEMTRSKKLKVYDRVENWHGDFSLTFEGNPEALLFKDTTRLPMHPRVCMGCGFVGLFVNPTWARKLSRTKKV